MKKINRVLLVDDDNATNTLSKIIIERLNLAGEIITKTNGKDAISYLAKECKSTHKYPNLILLDLSMPVMDGFEFLKKYEDICKDIREDVFVVVLTSSHDAGDIIKLMELGNYFYVNKPLTTDKFLDIHHRFFRGN